MKKNFLNLRSLLALIHDVFAALVAWYYSFSLRFNFEIPLEYFALMKEMLIVVLPLQVILFLSFGLYRGTWRYASIPDLKRILLAVFVSTILLFPILFILNANFLIPRSVLVIDPILLILMMGGSRFFYRAIKEHQLYGAFLRKGEPVVIFGAEAAAISLVKDLAQSSEWRVVGLLDDDPSMHGREIHGAKVLGPITDLAEISSRHSLRHVIIAMPSANHLKRRKVLDLVNQLGLSALTVPAIDDLISGRLNVSHIRRVDVEDLLGRDIVNLDS